MRKALVTGGAGFIGSNLVRALVSGGTRAKVLDSLADIAAARSAFGFAPSVDMGAGLAEYVEWARKEAVR